MGKKKKNKNKNKKSKAQELVDAALAATPAQQEVLPTFDDVYSGKVLSPEQVAKIRELRPDVASAFGTSDNKVREWWEQYGKNEMPQMVDTFKQESGKMEAEDYAQSEALYKPYFEQQIANELEDLNAWSEAESISYDRSLRRARFSLAAAGAGIGNERTKEEGMITSDHNKTVQDTVTGVERAVGSERIKGAGFQSTGQTQEGSIVGTMKAAIQEGQLWHKKQRSDRYYGVANTYYAQPSPYALDGSKL